MIDIQNAKKEFEKYVSAYDMENPKIELKRQHTYRTIDIAKQVAKSINLKQEDIELAELIALLHDIARFEQLKQFNTYNDLISFDHADYGVKLLFEDGLIRKFIREDQYDEIIFKAIKNHNKYEIEKGLNEKELLHAKIIRDADKTDIYACYVRDIEENRGALYQYDEIAKQKVTPEVLQIFLNHQLINRIYPKNEIDKVVTALAFIYDYHFIKGVEIIKECHYIEKILARIDICEETKEQTELLRKVALQYLDNKIQGGTKNESKN